MIGMKFVSPNQRGTTCWCRWAAIPAPATVPWFMPMLKPAGCETSVRTAMARWVSSAISRVSSAVASTYPLT